MSRKRAALVAWRARIVLGLAIALVLLLLAGCGQSNQSGSGTSSLPKGWTWYHDAKFSFDIPVPPQWTATSYSESLQQGGDECNHKVALVPPGISVDDTRAPVPRVLELISLAVVVNCPEWSTTVNPYFKPEAVPVVISGSSSTLYDSDIPTSYISRMAVTRFGGHQYLFYFQYHYTPTKPPEHSQRELAIYKQVLQYFKWTGK
ncbi:MAG TPA: hypothetical protein VF510_05770 [Ktedonobacterales bacterium]